MQLVLLRYPEYALANDMRLPEALIEWIALQVRAEARLGKTRREHFLELRAYLGLSAVGLSDLRFLVQTLTDLGMQTDKGLLLAEHALPPLRERRVILPALTVVEVPAGKPSLAPTDASSGLGRATEGASSLPPRRPVDHPDPARGSHALEHTQDGCAARHQRQHRDAALAGQWLEAAHRARLQGLA